MKILMISGGITAPRLAGGVVAYIKELIEELIALDHEVIYLDMNGTSIWPFSYLSKSYNNSYTTYTLHGSGFTVGNLQGTYEPLKQVYPSRRVEFLVKKIVRAENPDIIHFHELIGFPVSLLKFLKLANYKTIFTSQDYYPLCPTIKLFKHDRGICTLKHEELVCKVCCEEAVFSWASWAYEVIGRAEKISKRYAKLWYFFRVVIYKLSRFLYQHYVSPLDFVTRRYKFIEYLAYIDVIICMSKLHLRVMTSIMGNSSNLRQIYLSRKTISEAPIKRIYPKAVTEKVIFVALNILSVEKGYVLLQKVFSEIEKNYKNFELRVYGSKGEDSECIKYIKSYTQAELDSIVLEADFGIVPSIWQEAYGYVGAEMLSRGLPLIVSSKGGMIEYVEQDKNGFIFDSDREDSFYLIIEKILTERGLRERILKSTLESCRKFKSFKNHVMDIERLYYELKK